MTQSEQIALVGQLFLFVGAISLLVGATHVAPKIARGIAKTLATPLTIHHVQQKAMAEKKTAEK